MRLVFTIISIGLIMCSGQLFAQKPDTTILHINKTTDFAVTGKGTATNWNRATWFTLPARSNTVLKTRVKMLYSDSGIYCMFHCEDRNLTATLKEDFLDLYNEDVVEVFFWTDESVPIYFEYELSPLNYELPILVPNVKGKFLGWRPWHYEGTRRTRHAVYLEMKNNKELVSWTGEFFIPYDLLRPLPNIAPQKGTRWRANFYRIDYDNKNDVGEWSWQLTRTNFHDFERFGTIVFD